MSNYNFTDSLSSLDFEFLSKDLLEAELGIRLENFREGKDQGIDLRYAPEKGQSLIVQCKRYTKYANLKSNIVNSELSKIQKLNPARYILTTAVSLSAQQTDEIKMVLSPFIKSSGDIFGKDRLNRLLDKHSEIERRHIKLWVGSKGVLESILNAGTHIVSREEIARTIAAAKIYVHNSSFEEALRILKDKHVCIISGLPGIGKTTLARMLLLHFHKQGFGIVKIETDVSEARKVGYHNKSTLYYYDDFLGQTSQADKLNKNEDQALIDFMRSVRVSKDSLFVLTTREYILNQAKLHYEKLDREKFEHRTCVLDLTKYTRQSKAQILYNHLHVSDLPRPYLERLVTNDEYLKIIDHKNYNPRIIEQLTSGELIGEVPPEVYPSKFIEALNNPVSIWTHPFQNQISQSARNLLIVFTTLPKEVMINDAEKAFQNFHRKYCAEFRVSFNPQDFRNALIELEGTFVKKRKVGDTRLVGFSNASILDFMKIRLIEENWLSRIIGCFVFFEQPQWIFETFVNSYVGTSLSRDLTFIQSIITAFQDLMTAESCLFEVSVTDEQVIRKRGNQAFRLAYISKISFDLDNKNDYGYINQGLDELSRRLELSTLSWRDCLYAVRTFNSLGYLRKKTGKRFLSCLKIALMKKPFELSQLSALAEIFAMSPASFTKSELEEIRNDAVKFVKEFVADYDYEFENDFDDITFQVSKLGYIGHALNIDISDDQETLREHAIRVKDNLEEHETIFVSENRYSTPLAQVSDTEIKSMFRTLLV